jgi:hypothetical protein
MILPRLNGKLTRNRGKIAAKVHHLKNLSLASGGGGDGKRGAEGAHEAARGEKEEEWMLSHLT